MSMGPGSTGNRRPGEPEGPGTPGFRPGDHAFFPYQEESDRDHGIERTWNDLREVSGPSDRAEGETEAARAARLRHKPD
jgi:hypothetical protein